MKVILSIYSLISLNILIIFLWSFSFCLYDLVFYIIFYIVSVYFCLFMSEAFLKYFFIYQLLILSKGSRSSYRNHLSPVIHDCLLILKIWHKLHTLIVSAKQRTCWETNEMVLGFTATKWHRTSPFRFVICYWDLFQRSLTP